MSSTVHSSNQSKFSEYEKLIDSKQALKLKPTARLNQEGQLGTTIFERYVFVKKANGTYLTQDEFSHFSPNTIKKIEQLVQMTFDAMRLERDTSPDKEKEQAFIDNHTIQYVNPNDEKADLKDRKLAKSYQNSYYKIYGNIIDQMTSDQQAITQVGSKDDVYSLKDKTFIETYERIRIINPSYSHDKIFQLTLANYTKKILDQYLSALNKSNEARKKMSEFAYKKIHSNDQRANQNWLKEEANFSNLSHCKAIFQAIYINGQENLTTKHSFSALIDQVKEGLYESKMNTIDEVIIYERPSENPEEVTDQDEVINQTENLEEVRNQDETTSEGTPLRDENEQINQGDDHEFREETVGTKVLRRIFNPENWFRR